MCLLWGAYSNHWHWRVLCRVVLQYNRMTEQQERAREAAIAAIKARGDAIGDIATRDKAAAKKRQEDEDARLVAEAARARVKAKEAEAREKKEVCVCVCVTQPPVPLTLAYQRLCACPLACEWCVTAQPLIRCL